MTTAAASAIHTRGLVKTFRAMRAVDGLDLTVARGGVFGLLGPNGAGKTTTIRILATLVRADAGSAHVLGNDVAADPGNVRRRIALTGQFASLDRSLTGYENLLLQARLLGLDRREARQRAAELLDEFGLTDASRRPVKNYSGGMQRRLDIAASVVVRPELLFLDEPTTGLDPLSRNQVWDTVRRLVKRGTTIVLTTQYLDEADQLSDRIAVLDRGRIIADGTPGELKAAVGYGVLRVRLQAPAQRERARQVLSDALGVRVDEEPDPVELTARIDTDAADHRAGEQVGRAMTQLSHYGIPLATFALGEPSMDEVFLALTGSPAPENNTGKEPR